MTSAKLGFGHIVLSITSVVVGVIFFLYWSEDANLAVRGHGWEVWLHVVCGVFYFIPGVFACLFVRKRRKSIMTVCVTTSFYGMAMCAVQTLFATFTVVSAWQFIPDSEETTRDDGKLRSQASLTMILISSSLIVVAIVELVLCIITITYSIKKINEMEKARPMIRTRSRSSFCSPLHPAARFNPIAMESLDDEKYPANTNLINPATRGISFSTTHIASTSTKKNGSQPGVGKYNSRRFLSVPNLTFPDPPSEPPPPLEIQPPDLTSQTDTLVTSNVNSSSNYSTASSYRGEQQRSTRPDVAKRGISVKRMNSYREMRREQSLREYQVSDSHKYGTKENVSDSTDRHKEPAISYHGNTSAISYHSNKTPEKIDNYAEITRREAKRSSNKKAKKTMQENRASYRQEVRLDPRELNQQFNYKHVEIPNYRRPPEIHSYHVQFSDMPQTAPSKPTVKTTNIDKVIGQSSDLRNDRNMHHGKPNVDKSADPGTTSGKQSHQSRDSHANNMQYNEHKYQRPGTESSERVSTPPYRQDKDDVWKPRNNDTNQNIYENVNIRQTDQNGQQYHPRGMSPRERDKTKYQIQQPTEIRRMDLDSRTRNGDNKPSYYPPISYKQHIEQHSIASRNQYYDSQNQTGNKQRDSGQTRTPSEYSKQLRGQHYDGHKKPQEQHAPSSKTSTARDPNRAKVPSHGYDVGRTQGNTYIPGDYKNLAHAHTDKYSDNSRPLRIHQSKSVDDLREGNRTTQDSHPPSGFQVKLRVRDNEGGMGKEVFYYSNTSLCADETDI